MNTFHVKAIVEAKSKNGSSIKIGEDWFSSFKGAGLQDVEKGTEVEFDWAPDKTGKWKNIDSKTLKVTQRAAPQPAAGQPYTPKNNIGMELGHAAKLAMDYVLAMADPVENVLDEWEQVTVEIYQRMKRLRTQAEAGFPEVSAQSDADEEPSPF